MTAVVIPMPALRQGKTAALQLAARGYSIGYRHGEANRCPGCGRSHWWVGRVSAECAFCATALPFVTPPTAAREDI